MKKELENKIFADFPLLYIDKDESFMETPMHYGLAVDNGWEPIIRELSSKLEPLIVQWLKDNPGNLNHPRAAQVKEKFGRLRVYVDGATDEMHGLIKEAESKSSQVCEVCGAPGKLRTAGWFKTLCDYCSNRRYK